MTDVHEPEVRSYNMSRIRSKDTKPEQQELIQPLKMIRIFFRAVQDQANLIC